MSGPKFKKTVDRQNYIDRLNGFFQLLIAANLAPEEFRSITDANYDAANDLLQQLINQKTIMLPALNKLEGTTPLQFINKLSELTSAEDKLSGDQLQSMQNSGILLYDQKKGEYMAVNINGDSAANEMFTLKHSNVWRSMDAIREAVHNLDADLEGTKRPWSSDSDEFKAVKKNLSELSRKLKEMNPFTLDDKGNLTSRDYSFEDMTKDFAALMSSIGDYRESHHSNKKSSPRQLDRLKIMSRITTVYDNVRFAGVKKLDKNGKPIELTANGFKLHETLDNICLTKLRLYSPTYYKAALKNRAFFNHMKSLMAANEAFKKDSSQLGPEGLAKLTEEDLNEKAYFYYNEGEARDDHLKSYEMNLLMNYHAKIEHQDVLSNRKGLIDSVESKEGYTFDFTADERMFLTAYANDRGIKFTDNNERLSTDDMNKVNTAFMDEVKSGNLIVFNRNGQRAESIDALHIVTDHLIHQDGKAAFFRYNKNESAFIAQDMVLASKEGSSAFMISGFKDDANMKLAGNYFQICESVIKEIRDLRKDLYSARSFWHSDEHNALSDALDDACEEINKLDITQCEPNQLRQALGSLVEKAGKYAESHQLDSARHSLNDNQVNRLIVAQKIMSIDESISNPETTYKEYLVNRYAKKITLDTMAAAAAEYKNAKAHPADKNSNPKEYLRQIAINASDQLLKSDLTGNTKGQYASVSPKDWLNSKQFKNFVNEKSIPEMESLLKEEPEKTLNTFKIPLVQNVNAKHQVMKEAEKIMRNDPKLTFDDLDLGDYDILRSELDVPEAQVRENNSIARV